MHAQLYSFLGDFEGPFEDLDLRHFATVSAFSSSKSGSSEAPERAQICAMMFDVPTFIFFSEPILGPPKVDFSRENEKRNVKKSDIARTSPSERFVC